MRNLTKRRLLSTAAGMAALAVIAACGSSGGGTSSSSGDADPGSSTTITIGGAGPIQSSVLSQPERQAAEEAAISVINADGGINGHQLKLDYCDTQNTANGEFTCMRQLVSDNVAAIVDPGLIVDQSGRGLKFAAAEGVPIIGGQGLTPIEFSTPGSFPLSSGIPGWSYGQVVSLIKAGAKKIALWGTNESGSQYILSFTEQAMKLAGLKPVRYVQTDPNADPTFAEGAAEVMAGGVDGVIYDSSPTYGDKAIQALRAAGYKGPIASITGVYTPQMTQALGATANNLYLTSQVALSTDTSNPGVSAFLAAMKKYQPSAEVDETAMTAWTAVQLFAAVAKTIKGDVTSSSVMAATNNLSSPIDLQTAGPYKVKGTSSTITGYPRIYNPTVVIGVVKNGVLEPFGQGFIDPFTSLSANAGT
jgi:ABC-type branched-subunit amino acid transport system substrate-binding protein